MKGCFRLRCWWLTASVVAASGALLASAMAATKPPAHGHHQHGHAHEAGSTPQSLAERRQLLEVGEGSLVAGDVEGARRAFEQAANMAHSAEIELGILRTQMQAGEYRQALAFAAHTAGVHLDDVEGAIFYAWLLNLGAQLTVADQVLQQAERRVPAHPLLREVRHCLRTDMPLASGALLALPVRLAPWSTGEVVSPQARVAASALLLADGRHALAPRVAISASGVIWLRNGLGQTVSARPVKLDGAGRGQAADADAPGLVMLELVRPLPVAGGDIVSPRDAFPGSPAFAMDYPIDAAGQPAWPLMRAGFLGAPLSTEKAGAAWAARRLGVALPAPGSPRGGPVYDQGGRLIGLALGGRSVAGADGVDQADRLVPISILRSHFGDRFGVPTPEPRPTPIGADELYERAMRTSLQVLVSAP